MSLLLLPNLGAEEGVDTPPTHPAAVTLATLWTLLFPRDAGMLESGPPAAWPAALDVRPDAPAFEWLPSEGAAAWLNTDEAERRAAAAGLALSGASAAVVRAVHDKAFAQICAEQEHLVPRALRGLIRVFSPEELAEPDAAARRIQAELVSWPDWTGGRYTLKPRLGCSGRGRVAGEKRADTEAVRNALPRLRERGGAVLEPWLSRGADWSVQLHLAEGGEVTLLATLEQIVSASGLWRGHRGEIDTKGRIVSAGPWDDDLLSAAMDVARLAHERGYHGPCGLDAFDFAGPEGGVVLRPVVELNARFTAGTVLAGLLRRARPRAVAHFGLQPGQRLPFRFALQAPEGGWPIEAPDLLTVPLWNEGNSLRPALAFSRSDAVLAERCGF